MSSVFDQDASNRLASLTTGGTGSLQQNPATRLIVCPFEQYEVVFAVTDDNQVVGVVEVHERKDFRSVQQKIASAGHFNIEQYINE